MTSFTVDNQVTYIDMLLQLTSLQGKFWGKYTMCSKPHSYDGHQIFSHVELQKHFLFWLNQNLKQGWFINQYFLQFIILSVLWISLRWAEEEKKSHLSVKD